MRAIDGRTKGKRIRKPQAGNSNTKARWMYLSADVNDVIDKPVAKLTAMRTISDTKLEKASSKGGYDIDGDGIVDIREMRLAKFLDNMLHDRRKDLDKCFDPTEADLLKMRQSAGKLLIGKEFVERNHNHLWRYGSIFTGMNDEQAAEFIAKHKNFRKLMSYLESTERDRIVRSSHQARKCIQGDAATAVWDKPTERQSWIETPRKVCSEHPLPDLQLKKKLAASTLNFDNVIQMEKSLDTSESSSEVFTNAYGAIDIDGDGVVDDDEMKMHLRLQDATSTTTNHDEMEALHHSQQLEGRKMMVADFVQRNAGQMWLYDPSFRHKSTKQIVDEIASSAGFAAEFNRLRVKERVVQLESSMGVANCIVQLPAANLPATPSNTLEFRRVKNRSELLLVRKELLKPLRQRGGVTMDGDGSTRLLHCRPRGIREEHGEMGRSRSEGSLLIGLPQIYDVPVKIAPISSFSVTKWSAN